MQASDQSAQQMLGVENVVPYLRSRRVLPNGERATAVALGGGVSNVVLAVTSPTVRVVVKQPLSRLRVRDEWTADRRRILAEAAALQMARNLTPNHVPQVVDIDQDRMVLSLERAPQRWSDWKTLLLAGHVSPHVARELGHVLGSWHSASAGSNLLPNDPPSAESFRQLRVEPYYLTTMKRLPELEPPIARLLDRMLSNSLSVVHGDFSPKNVLVGQRRTQLWVIDFEVAHFGDPTFDLAFMLTHLLLKSIHRPKDAASLARCSTEFAAAYEDTVGIGLRPAWDYVFGHVGCLLLARVVGKSPAEYLTQCECATALRLGRDLVLQPPVSVVRAWQLATKPLAT